LGRVPIFFSRGGRVDAYGLLINTNNNSLFAFPNTNGMAHKNKTKNKKKTTKSIKLK